MDAVRGYLLSVISAALCCGILTGILGKKGICGGTVKFLCGIVMILVIVSPILNVRLKNFTEFFDDMSFEAGAVTAFGQESATDAYGDIIKSRTAAYILDKAKSLGAELTVEVTLSEVVPMAPCAVRLSGAISPYAKKVLSDTIARDLGIKTEEQTWTG